MSKKMFYGPRGGLYIQIDYDVDTLPFLKSLPDAKWEPTLELWSISSSVEDRARILEVAEQLEIEVPDEIRNIDYSDEVCDLVDAAQQKGLYPFQIKGVEFLVSKKKAMLGDDMGLGKAQSLTSKILTPSGWSTMGELRVGDEVMGADGKPTRVTGVYPQGEKEMFEVEFSDGSKTQCCEEHLWVVNTPSRRSRGDMPRTLSLKQIVDSGLRCSSGNLKYFIPLVSPVEHSETSLPINPYVLGVILRDGSIVLGPPRISCPDEQVFEEVLKRLPEGVSANKIKNTEPACLEYSLTTGRNSHSNPITDALRIMKLQGRTSLEKFIPEEYLFASIKQRRELLAGLLDTDGSAFDSTIEYSSSSRELSRGVVHIVQSLGGTARLKSRKTFYSYKGEKRQGQDSYRVTITMPNGFNPFKLSRKASALRRAGKYGPSRAIKRIESLGRMEAQCIEVETDDNLYITDDYIVTHNTVQAIMSLPPNNRVLIICPSVVKHNWRKEILNWRSDYEVFVAVKKTDVRPPKIGEIVVVNHDILPGKLAGNRAVIPKEYYGLVIVSDEAHYAKNRKSIRTKKVRALCMKASKVIGLTGTPLANHPMDLYSVLWSHDLDIEAFGGMAGFVRAYGGTEGDYGGYVFGKPRPEAPELLRRVMLRRLKEDVLPELPRKTYRNLEVPLSNKIKKEMDKIDKVYGTLIMKGDLPPFDKFSKVRKALASDRVPAMLEIVEVYEEAERPLLVFSAHREPIDALGLRPGWAVITGDVPSEKRFEIAERFQKGELIGIALTIAAGGVGLTLTRAPEILFVDLAWRPCDNAQAEDRICRIGQTSDSVLITRMMSDHPLDKHVNQLLIDKQLLIESVVEKSGAGNLLMGNREEIFDSAERKVEEMSDG